MPQPVTASAPIYNVKKRIIILEVMNGSGVQFSSTAHEAY